MTNSGAGSPGSVESGSVRRERDAFRDVGQATRESIEYAIDHAGIADLTARVFLSTLAFTASYSRLGDFERVESLAQIARVSDLKEYGRRLRRLADAGALAIDPDYTRRVRRGEPIWIGLRGHPLVRQSPLMSVVQLPPLGGSATTEPIEGGFREGPREGPRPSQLPVEVSTTAIEQSPAAQSLSDRALTKVAAAELDPVKRAVEHLRTTATDFQHRRTEAAIRNVVRTYNLTSDDVMAVLVNLDRKLLAGEEICKGECQYVVGGLGRLGRMRRAA